MDDLENIIAYLYEMATTGQGAKLTPDDVDVLMKWIEEVVAAEGET